MLTSVFVGRENVFNLVFANWLATQTDLRGIVWADCDRYSNVWRRKWLRRSLKRDGVLTTIDRIRFRLWLSRSVEMRAGLQRMCDDVKEAYPCSDVRGKAKQLFAESIKSAKTDSFLTELEPQVIIVNCVSQLIPKKLCKMPSHGLYIYHEGLTPEYKGMHTPFWAIADGNDDKVGYTLLRANEKFDGGPVFVQGVTALDPLATSLGYTGHWALAEGFPKIGAFLQALESGSAQPIDTSGRREGYYSYMTYSHFRKVVNRRREKRLDVRPDDVVYR